MYSDLILPKFHPIIIIIDSCYIVLFSLHSSRLIALISHVNSWMRDCRILFINRRKQSPVLQNSCHIAHRILCPRTRQLLSRVFIKPNRSG